MKAKIYIETSVVSYLTARPTHDLTIASRQATTRDLWENLQKFEAYGSDLVVGEAEKGHPEAAASRLKEIERLPLLEITSEAEDLASALIEGSAIPKSEPEDALHLGIAASNGIDIVVTWNFKHLNNPFTRLLVRQVIENAGYTCPEICSPEELLEGASK
jgi:predicted nucleic acid-binding protein